MCVCDGEPDCHEMQRFSRARGVGPRPGRPGRRRCRGLVRRGRQAGARSTAPGTTTRSRRCTAARRADGRRAQPRRSLRRPPLDSPPLADRDLAAHRHGRPRIALRSRRKRPVLLQDRVGQLVRTLRGVPGVLGVRVLVEGGVPVGLFPGYDLRRPVRTAIDPAAQRADGARLSSSFSSISASWRPPG